MTQRVSVIDPRADARPGAATGRTSVRAVAWQAQVLAALAQYSDGTCITSLTWKLAGCTRSYQALHSRIYRALRACEANGHARQAGYLRTRAPFAWSLNTTLRNGQLPVIWQITPADIAFLAQTRRGP